MADQRLQQLRRAWDEGDLEAQARLLCERMRAGELAEERMRLAALLGDSSSSQIIGRNTALTVEEIPAACAEFSAEAQVRIMLAAFAAAWPATPLNEEPRCLHSDYRQRIEAWTCCPCSDCASQLANVDEDFWILGWYVSSGEFLTACLTIAADLILGGRPQGACWAGSLGGFREAWLKWLRRDYRHETVARIQRRIRDEVVL